MFLNSPFVANIWILLLWMKWYAIKHLITLWFLFIKSRARILQPVRTTRASVNLDLPVQPVMSCCPVTKCVETMALVVSRERRKCVFAAKASPEVSASTHSISAPNRKYKPGTYLIHNVTRNVEF